MQKDEPDHATMHKQPGMSEIECNLTKANAKKIKITNANILGSKEKSEQQRYLCKQWKNMTDDNKIKKESKKSIWLWELFDL